MEWTSEDFREYIRERPCLSCAAPKPSDPHHVGTPWNRHHRRAVDLVVPLCRKCHAWIEENPALEPQVWQWLAMSYLEDWSEEDLLSSLPLPEFLKGLEK
jgi:hypothetical protein